jgi:GT2 family glycosyltransferase
MSFSKKAIVALNGFDEDYFFYGEEQRRSTE